MLTLGVTRVRCKRKWLTVLRGRIRVTRVPGHEMLKLVTLQVLNRRKNNSFGRQGIPWGFYFEYCIMFWDVSNSSL